MNDMIILLVKWKIFWRAIGMGLFIMGVIFLIYLLKGYGLYTGGWLTATKLVSPKNAGIIPRLHL